MFYFLSPPSTCAPVSGSIFLCCCHFLVLICCLSFSFPSSSSFLCADPRRMSQCLFPFFTPQKKRVLLSFGIHEMAPARGQFPRLFFCCCISPVSVRDTTDPRRLRMDPTPSHCVSDWTSRRTNFDLMSSFFSEQISQVPPSRSCARCSTKTPRAAREPSAPIKAPWCEQLAVYSPL